MPPRAPEKPETVRQIVRRLSFERFKEGWYTDFAPKKKRKPSEWATQVRIIPAGTSPLARGFSLRYDHSIFPHSVEIMDAADEPGVRKIVMWFAIREGKTMSVCANVWGRHVTDDPLNAYSVHPVEPDADRFSEGDIEPMITETPDLSSRFVAKKSRDSGRTKSFKKHIGGWFRIVSSGADTAFRGTSVGLLMLHELDALDKDAINAAIGRTTGFPNATIIMESTGTLAATINPETGAKEYRSNIEQEYDQGDKRKWFCPCQNPACGHLQVVRYSGIKFPPGEPEKARYECAECGYLHSAPEWRKMAATGKWYPTAGLTEEQERDILNTQKLAKAIDSSVRSYWRNGFTSLLPHHSAYVNKLHEFAAQGEAAAAGQESDKRIWTQERAAELWNPTSESEEPPAWKPIFEGRESYEVAPMASCYMTIFVDCQLDRLEGGRRVWGPREESWGINPFVIEGSVREAGTWQRLAMELSKTTKHESGTELVLGMALIDGGAYWEDVYQFFVMLAAATNAGHTRHNDAKEFFKGVPSSRLSKLAGHVRASKGFGKHGHPIIDRKMMTVAKNLKGHHIGTWEAKDRIYERLRDSFSDAREDTMEGRIHFNKSYQEAYFRGLVSESPVIEWKKGIEIKSYENPKRLRNEPLDIEVGNLAAFHLHPRDMEDLHRQVMESAKPPEVQKKQQAQPVASGSNYALGGLRW